MYVCIYLLRHGKPLLPFFDLSVGSAYAGMTLNVRNLCKAQFRENVENRIKDNKSRQQNMFLVLYLLTGIIFLQGELITSNNSGHQDCEMITIFQRIYYT